MVGDRRQCVAEAKAVRQEDVLAALSELFLKVIVAVQDIAEQALRRGDVDITVFIGAAGDVPAPVSDVLFELFELLGVVLFHQLISVRALKAESVLRVFLKPFKVLVQRLWNVLGDGRLKCPVPGCIQV